MTEKKHVTNNLLINVRFLLVFLMDKNNTHANAVADGQRRIKRKWYLKKRRKKVPSGTLTWVWKTKQNTNKGLAICTHWRKDSESEVPSKCYISALHKTHTHTQSFQLVWTLKHPCCQSWLAVTTGPFWHFRIKSWQIARGRGATCYEMAFSWYNLWLQITKQRQK